MNRLPNESSKAFVAFQEYARMGSERTQEAVCAKLAKSRGLISRWSHTYGWVARAAEYDAEQDLIIAKAQLKVDQSRALKIAKLKAAKLDNDLELVDQMRDRLRAMFKHPIHAIERNENGVVVSVKPAGWTMDTAFRGVGTLDQFERLTLGLPTAKTESVGAEGGPVQVVNTSSQVIVYIPDNGRDKPQIQNGSPAKSAQESAQVVDKQEDILSPIGDTLQNGHQNGELNGH